MHTGKADEDKIGTSANSGGSGLCPQSVQFRKLNGRAPNALRTSKLDENENSV